VDMAEFGPAKPGYDLRTLGRIEKGNADRKNDTVRLFDRECATGLLFPERGGRF